jgi:IS5 family transposase
MFVHHHRDQKLQQYTGSLDRTIWLFKQRLSRGGLDAQSTFDAVQQQLQAHGDIPRGGQIIDATLVRVPIQHMITDEKSEVYQGKTPENWGPKKTVHKDTDARWTTKYKKNPRLQVPPHVGARGKLNRRWAVTPANVDCRQDPSQGRGPGNTAARLYADRGYDHHANRQVLAECDWKDGIARMAGPGQELGERRTATRPSTAGELPCRARLRAVAPPGRKDRVRGNAGAQRTCYRAQVRGLQRQAPGVATGALMAQVRLLVGYPACCRAATAGKCAVGTPESTVGRHRGAHRQNGFVEAPLLAIDAVADRMLVLLGIEALTTSPDIGLVEKTLQ